jgi:hypothetical protein
VDSAFDDQETRQDGQQDREYSLKQQASETTESELEEEDQDLNSLPKNMPLKADRNL